MTAEPEIDDRTQAAGSHDDDGEVAPIDYATATQGMSAAPDESAQTDAQPEQIDAVVAGESDGPVEAPADSPDSAESGANQDADDVAEAIERAKANFEEEAAQSPTESDTSQAEGTHPIQSGSSVSWLPFVIYDVIWLAFAAALVWRLREVPLSQPIYDTDLYALAVWGGAAFTLVGPILILLVWATAWGRPGARRGQLLISALIKGSAATLFGVTMWWIALMVLDQIRLGRLL